jgi:hypothetical protein
MYYSYTLLDRTQFIQEKMITYGIKKFKYVSLINVLLSSIREFSREYKRLMMNWSGLFLNLFIALPLKMSKRSIVNLIINKIYLFLDLTVSATEKNICP